MTHSRPNLRAFRVAAAAACLCASLLPFAARAADVTDGIKEQIEDINGDVKSKRAQLEELNRKADRFRDLIQEKKAESASLEDQIALLENRSAKTQLDIDIAKDEVRKLELETSVLDAKMKEQEARMGRERVLLGGLARKLYRQQFRKSTFDVLLTRRTLAEFFDAIRQISELQSGVRRSLVQLTELKADLGREKDLRETKRLAIEDNKRKMEVARRELEDQRALKEAILIETKASELEYRYLLAELKHEQDDADSEISYLEKTLRQKLDLADRLKGDDAVLSWPVPPLKGLSTRFHDPEYPFRYVFEHPGIDIRQPQGSPVHAAAAGVVARAKDAGMGYSYVMIIHNNDVSTVYGHLSRILAREDAFVERGEVIGYSGGMPGTPGAGRLTTGPHLHFESRIHGIPADPLRFLVTLD